MSKKRFISVAGNIGVGKTTLVNKLSSDLGWQPFFEPVTENPYLQDFYENMGRWAFHSQIFFLTNRLQVHYELSKCRKTALQDRSIYEDAGIFAKNLHLQGSLSDRDFVLYNSLYEKFSANLPRPDLMIYLRANTSTLVSRIKSRNRTFEKEVPLDYISQLNSLYDDWAGSFSLSPILTIQTDELNLVKNEDDYKGVKKKILHALGS